MKRITSTAFLLAVSSALLGTIPSQAQTASQQGYLTLPPAPQANPNSSGAVVYSAQEYPTAQGQYLKLPAQKPAAAATTASYAPPLTVINDAAPPSRQIQPQAVSAQPQQYPMVFSNANASSAPVNAPIGQTSYAQTSYVPASNVPASNVTTNALPPAPQAIQPQSMSAPVPSQQVAATSLDQLPSYQYNPAFDTSRTPYKTPKANDPKSSAKADIPLGTIPGMEIAVQFSDYRYQEHLTSDTDFVRMLGPKGGATFDYNGSLSDGWFMTGNLRGAYGENSYQAVNGRSATGISDWLFEIRALIGKDFVFNDELWGLTSFSVSPYVGLGFRFLFNEASSIQPGGYDRYSHYLYIPVGFTPRFRVTHDSRISWNVEYDQLLYAWQESDFSSQGGPDLNNTQYHGWGARTSVMWEWKTWSFGPFLYYWNIGEFDLTCASGSSFLICGDEPSNQTLEGGVQVKYRF